MIQFAINAPTGDRPLDGQNSPQHDDSRRPSVLTTSTMPNNVAVALNTMHVTSTTSAHVGTIHTPSLPRYTIEQSDYITALHSAADSRRQAVAADAAVAALYEKLMVCTDSQVKTELIAALKMAAQEHQKCVDQDMLVIRTFESVLVSQRGSQNVWMLDLACRWIIVPNPILAHNTLMQAASRARLDMVSRSCVTYHTRTISNDALRTSCYHSRPFDRRFCTELAKISNSS